MRVGPGVQAGACASCPRVHEDTTWRDTHIVQMFQTVPQTCHARPAAMPVCHIWCGHTSMIWPCGAESRRTPSALLLTRPSKLRLDCADAHVLQQLNCNEVLRAQGRQHISRSDFRWRTICALATVRAASATVCPSLHSRLQPSGVAMSRNLRDVTALVKHDGKSHADAWCCQMRCGLPVTADSSSTLRSLSGPEATVHTAHLSGGR